MNNINKITKAFENKKALIAFITGGDPDIETTEKLILAMEETGVDIIEIGIPFSDPVAEGPVIEKADIRALAGGCTTDKLFEMIKKVRAKTNMPLLFMTYINPIYKYGKEKFMAKCEETGINGVIIPDLPFEEKDELGPESQKHGVCLISMISPTSGENGDRIEKIAEESEGFLYCVSSLGVTGMRSEINTDISELIKKVRKVSDVPCAVGFGVSTPEQARDMAKISDGVIVGSAIVSIIADFGKNSIEPVKEFVKKLKSSIS